MLLNSIRHTIKPLFAASIISVSALMTLAVLLDSSSAQARQANALNPTRPTTIADVSVVDFAFDPAVVTITVGSTVRWTRSNTTVTHTTTSDTSVWDSGDLAPNVPFTHTFDTPGIYPYHCAIHLGMQAVVIVINPPRPPTDVTVDGPTNGVIDTPNTFTATVSPLTATLPITYLWQSTGQSDVTHVGGLSDTIVFTWPAGTFVTQLVTVTAANDSGMAVGGHSVIFNAPYKVYLPLVLNATGP